MRSTQADANGMRTIVGRVTSAGAVQMGVGFTSRKSATGDYRVYFAAPFRLLAIGIAGTGTHAFNNAGPSADGSEAIVLFSTTAGGGTAVDSGFSFTATGRAA